MLETCKGGPRPISLHVEKTQNFDQVLPPRPWRPKWTKFLLEGRLYVCMLKRLKFWSSSPTAALETKMDQIFYPPVSPNLKPLQKGPALYAGFILDLHLFPKYSLNNSTLSLLLENKPLSHLSGGMQQSADLPKTDFARHQKFLLLP